MPRSRSHTKYSLATSAMKQFWMHGYEATSLDDLVKSTGVSRHGIYGDYGGKRALFLASLHAYQTSIVTPAFANVEIDNANLDAVAVYFEHQINRADNMGLPGPGCLIANTMTEVAPHDDDVRKLVDEHNARLWRGFRNALRNEGPKLSENEIDSLAISMVVFAQGLWSASRVTSEASSLRQAVHTFLNLISTRIAT